MGPQAGWNAQEATGEEGVNPSPKSKAAMNFLLPGYITIPMFLKIHGKKINYEAIRRLRDLGLTETIKGATVIKEDAPWPFQKHGVSNIPLWKRCAIEQGYSK